MRRPPDVHDARAGAVGLAGAAVGPGAAARRRSARRPRSRGAAAVPSRAGRAVRLRAGARGAVVPGARARAPALARRAGRSPRDVVVGTSGSASASSARTPGSTASRCPTSARYVEMIAAGAVTRARRRSRSPPASSSAARPARCRAAAPRRPAAGARGRRAAQRVRGGRVLRVLLRRPRLLRRAGRRHRGRAPRGPAAARPGDDPGAATSRTSRRVRVAGAVVAPPRARPTGCGSRSTDELDAVGPYARRALARHGLLWPFNAHFHAPMLEQAAGGDAADRHRRRRAVGASSRDRRPARRRVLAARAARRCGARCSRARDADRLSRGCARAAGARPGAPPAARRAAAPRRRGRGWRCSRGMRYTAVGTRGARTCSRPTPAPRSRIRCSIVGLWAAVAAAAPRAGFARPRRRAGRRVAGHLLPGRAASRAAPRRASTRSFFSEPRARVRATDGTARGVPADARRRGGAARALAGRRRPTRTR